MLNQKLNQLNKKTGAKYLEIHLLQVELKKTAVRKLEFGDGVSIPCNQ